MKALGGQGGGGGVGCFEFWLYRYQTLVAAFVALIAALITVRPVRNQLAEMRRQSAQQAFQALRSLRVQIAEETVLVQDIKLNAKYCLAFEQNYPDNTNNPLYARSYSQRFGQLLTESERLEIALRQSGAKQWGSADAELARDAIYQAGISLQQGILAARVEIDRVTSRFSGTYTVEDWRKASSELLSISLNIAVAGVMAACEALQHEHAKELARLDPALKEATERAFGFS
jgi:hypothetical protein